MEPREILPGVFHWTATHPKIGVGVGSYLLGDARVGDGRAQLRRFAEA